MCKVLTIYYTRIEKTDWTKRWNANVWHIPNFDRPNVHLFGALWLAVMSCIFNELKCSRSPDLIWHTWSSINHDSFLWNSIKLKYKWNDHNFIGFFGSVIFIIVLRIFLFPLMCSLIPWVTTIEPGQQLGHIE